MANPFDSFHFPITFSKERNALTNKICSSRKSTKALEAKVAANLGADPQLP